MIMEAIFQIVLFARTPQLDKMPGQPAAHTRCGLVMQRGTPWSCCLGHECVNVCRYVQESANRCLEFEPRDIMVIALGNWYDRAPMERNPPGEHCC